MSDKPRPYSYDAEQSVLGAALQNMYAADEATEKLSAEDFYDRQNAEIFSAISEISHAGTPVDLVTVTEALKRRGMLDMIGGAKYLSELISAVPAPTNIRHYIDIVEDHSIRRKLIEVSESIIDMSASGKDEAGEVRHFAEKEILDIGRGGQREDFSPVGAVMNNTFKRMEELSKLGPGDVPGLTTGFSALDRVTLGLQESSLNILAARPSQGKTSLALNIALNSAFKKNAVVLVFSIEMSKSDLVLRMLSTRTGIELTELRTGRAIKEPGKATLLGEAADELAKTKLYIDDTSAIRINEIWNKSRRVKNNNEGKLDLIIVDYLQLMDVGSSAKTSARPENRQQEIATMTRMLKQLARDMECPVLVLSQLSREVERRGGKSKRPVLSDLRDSGAIEQDADLVMFIYKEELREDGSGPDIEKTRTISVAKNRNGEIDDITLGWDGRFTRFSHYNPSDDWRVGISGEDDDGAYLTEE